MKVITVHRASVVANGPHSITECGPKARTLFSLSLSEAEDAHTLTSVKAEGSTLSGRRGSAWTIWFQGLTSFLCFCAVTAWTTDHQGNGMPI